VEQLAQLALDVAASQGAQYADVRINAEKTEYLEVKQGKVGSITNAQTDGIGVRVIADGMWGFAASSQPTPEKVKQIAADAVRVAKASARVNTKRVELAPVKSFTGSWKNDIDIDPFSVPLENKLDLLLEADAEMRGVKGASITQASMHFWQEVQHFASTEGSKIDQTITQSGSGIATTAVGEQEVQVRSYPASFGGQYENRGYELIEELKLVENARRVGEEAVQLLSAPACPSGTATIILEGSQLALQVHESCGHPTELDRVFGSEANYAGTSFMTPEKLNNLQYGSSIVNLVADATVPGGLGSFGFDDEGVPAQLSYLVKEGLFVGYLTSRETAHMLGQDSNGTMRADGWQNLPLIRMTNINLLPGDMEYEDLIADTDEGILMSTVRSWSIDDRRLNFQFSTEAGWEIKNGKLGRLLKNPSYTGITPEFWGGCDAICGRKHWKVWGVPNCGKGQPPQVARVGHGVAPARFRNVQVGVTAGS
jgi:TldD protein